MTSQLSPTGRSLPGTGGHQGAPGDRGAQHRSSGRSAVRYSGRSTDIRYGLVCLVLFAALVTAGVTAGQSSPGLSLRLYTDRSEVFIWLPSNAAFQGTKLASAPPVPAELGGSPWWDGVQAWGADSSPTSNSTSTNTFSAPDVFTATAQPWLVLSVERPGSGQTTAVRGAAARALSFNGVPVGEPTTISKDGTVARLTTVRYDTPAGEVTLVEFRAVTGDGLVVSATAGCARGCFAASANELTDLVSALAWRIR
jgi:hypothetical protein